MLFSATVPRFNGSTAAQLYVLHNCCLNVTQIDGWVNVQVGSQGIVPFFYLCSMVPDGTFGIVGVFVTDERSVDRGAWLDGGAMATWRHVGRGFTGSIRCMPVAFARRRLNRLTFPHVLPQPPAAGLPRSASIVIRRCPLTLKGKACHVTRGRCTSQVVKQVSRFWETCLLRH